MARPVLHLGNDRAGEQQRLPVSAAKSALPGAVPGQGLICDSKFEHRFSDGPEGVRHRRCRINRAALQFIPLL